VGIGLSQASFLFIVRVLPAVPVAPLDEVKAAIK